MHEDGSGTELLSSQTVKELLCQAYLDPTIALLKEQLANTQGLMSPKSRNNWTEYNCSVVFVKECPPKNFHIVYNDS